MPPSLIRCHHHRPNAEKPHVGSRLDPPLHRRCSHRVACAVDRTRCCAAELLRRAVLQRPVASGHGQRHHQYPRVQAQRGRGDARRCAQAASVPRHHRRSRHAGPLRSADVDHLLLPARRGRGDSMGQPTALRRPRPLLDEGGAHRNAAVPRHAVVGRRAARRWIARREPRVPQKGRDLPQWHAAHHADGARRGARSCAGLRQARQHHHRLLAGRRALPPRHPRPARRQASRGA